MNINILTLNETQLPITIRQIPQPPKQLYYAGESLDAMLQHKRVAIVGSRTMTPYGRQVTTMLSAQLAERGIVIISGLAIGVDACALDAALKVGGKVIAVLPSPLDTIVPVSNQRLAKAILDNGGTLVSEYAVGRQLHKGNFVERNRLMSGLANVVLVTEAAVGSGTLHTTDFAADQGRTVLAVPGNITSLNSQGANQLIANQGARAVYSCNDIFEVLNEPGENMTYATPIGQNKAEQCLLDLLQAGVNDTQQLLRTSGMNVSEFSQTLTMLEITNKITAIGMHHWSLQTHDTLVT